MSRVYIGVEMIPGANNSGISPGGVCPKYEPERVGNEYSDFELSTEHESENIKIETNKSFKLIIIRPLPIKIIRLIV